MVTKFVEGVVTALWKLVLAFVAVGIAIGTWVYLGSHQANFNAAVNSGGNFATNAVTTAFDWGSAKMGGSTSGGQAATAGPQTIWVENTAPNRWQVGRAIKVWNEGLTTVQLKGGKCHSGAECIKVTQEKVFTPEGESLVLGKTSTWFGRKIRLNSDAVGQVPGSAYAYTSCHELGHALGLNGDELGGHDGHSTSKRSCMFPSAAGAWTKPAKADFDAVNSQPGR